MSTTHEYVKRAEECERLAAAFHSKASRETLQYVADLWRRMAKEPAASAIPCTTSEGDAGK